MSVHMCTHGILNVRLLISFNVALACSDLIVLPQPNARNMGVLFNYY